MYRAACFSSVGRGIGTLLCTSIHYNKNIIFHALCGTGLTGVTVTEASPCAASMLLRAAIDRGCCPSVPLPRPAIDAMSSFKSLVIHLSTMAPLQSPMSKLLQSSPSPVSNGSVQSPSKRIKNAGCTHRPRTNRSSRTRTEAKAKNDIDSHSSCPLTASSHQRSKIAKSQSRKVPDFKIACA